MGGDAGMGSEFGDLLRGLRKAKGMSLAALSEATGIDESRLSRLERGVNLPVRSDSRDSVVRLSQVLGDKDGRLLQLSGHAPRVDERTVRKRPPLRDLIATEPSLTSRQRAVLLAIVDSWESG